ncbi:MAG: diguanylate cyclase [Desulfobulbaceae bacterium]|nr:diguanylate cyclase [Desulfobulbaceae bacterium]HIJ79205.1 diguanylate cyclase [Deltaproteobacteria bacterium]
MKNTTILCVDDEPGVLEAYRKILQNDRGEESDVKNRLSARRRRVSGEKESELTGPDSCSEAPCFNVLTASSGEEAVDIVRRELDLGRQIAVGFFDMLMPGGIDGQETIARIRELDNQILCAVVTAYTDRSTMQIGKVFDRQEDWLYFNKPFTMGELSQSALHLVSAWNRRRNEEALVSRLEMMQNSLMGILDFVHDLNKIPPMILDHLLEGTLCHFLRLLDAEDGFVRLNDGEQKATMIGAGRFKGISADKLINMSSQWGLVEDAVMVRKPIVVEHMAAIPLQVGTLVQGVLFVQQEGPFLQDPKLLEMFASQAVNMIQNSQIYQELHSTNIYLSTTLDELQQTAGRLSRSEELREQYEKLTYYDVLTGLPNRRYLEVFFKQLLSRSFRQRNSMACLMMDLDHFKMINDSYGHPVGDRFLRELGGILNEYRRGHDFVCRYGGEEFTLLLENISAEDALIIGERIRRTVEAYTFNGDGQPVKATISMGIAVLKPTAVTTTAEIIEKADQALYEAKKKGRNCCVLAAEQ